jgi:hypothetical protein
VRKAYHIVIKLVLTARKLLHLWLRFTSGNRFRLAARRQPY